MTAPLLAHNRTYGAIEWNGKGWAITSIEPHVAIRLKQVFARINKTAKPPFVLTGGPQLDADLKWFMDRYPLRISADDAERMGGRKMLFETQQTELGAILAPNWMPPASVGFRGNMRPYSYQVQAAELVRRTGRLLLMDEMGLGKTVSAIAAIVAPDYLPALVVPQTHLPGQWAEKIGEFTELRTHIVKRTTPYQLPPVDVVICPYSKLAGWIDYAETAGFKSVVFDEIQELRSGSTTAKGAAAQAFARLAQLVLGLSGTPIYNYGEEIWRICDFLEEGCLGDWWDFIREWCKPGPGGKWLVKDTEALGTFLRESHLALRRTRTDVGHERKFANTIIHTISYDEKPLEDRAAQMAQLARQVISGSFTERGQAAREFDMMMRHDTGVAKAKHVAAFVRFLLEAKQPVLLCGWHRDVYDIWMDELSEFNPVLYTGSESPRQKAKAVQMFMDGASNLLIMSLRSGAGLDGLQQRCRTIVFGELDWSGKVHEQCVARLDRPGQEHQVDAIYLVADGGSDPAVMGVIGLKNSQAAGIVDPLSEPKEQNSDGTRIRQLAELYLQGKSHLAAPPAKPEPVCVPEDQQASMF
ncbi:SNF2-related protein [Hyphomicrobium denitrificans ATCC 51888]|uniref:SNF2-related protein n=1 Tax=Hyphomicrobium denitrificans (strain ATCC 51888 / DSM 1869 / NCIMB 11706 / TK 0415) TaxID=582899 RepID=D8JVF1_HYPDA|nr:DEAD/DEAH box helicase [Hyphomicrobium denitrificans]ADJ24805.1 SNF2-related protein [Hyphomicrobium denitrificans ATCC 51888]